MSLFCVVLEHWQLPIFAGTGHWWCCEWMPIFLWFSLPCPPTFSSSFFSFALFSHHFCPQLRCAPSSRWILRVSGRTLAQFQCYCKNLTPTTKHLFFDRTTCKNWRNWVLRRRRICCQLILMTSKRCLIFIRVLQRIATNQSACDHLARNIMCLVRPLWSQMKAKISN